MKTARRIFHGSDRHRRRAAPIGRRRGETACPSRRRGLADQNGRQARGAASRLGGNACRRPCDGHEPHIERRHGFSAGLRARLARSALGAGPDRRKSQGHDFTPHQRNAAIAAAQGLSATRNGPLRRHARRQRARHRAGTAPATNFARLRARLPPVPPRPARRAGHCLYRPKEGHIRARLFLARPRLQAWRAHAENQCGLLARKDREKPRPR